MATEEFLARISQAVNNAVSNLRVRSALNPFLWLGAVFSIILLAFAALFKSDPFISHLLAIAALCPMGVACFAGLHMLFFDRKALQSEDFQMRSQALKIIEEKGGKVTIDPASLQGIANPAPTRTIQGVDRKALPGGEHHE